MSVRLDARIAGRTATSLEIAYSVENTGSRPVYVCNRLYNKRTPEGVPLVYPNIAYVLFEPGPMPNITKRILDRDEGVNVEQPVQPCATRLGKGERFDEQFAVVLPVAPLDPYHPMQPRDPATAEASRGLALSIGWVAASDVDNVLVPVVPTNVGDLPVVKASPVVQHIERVEFDVTIPVLPPLLVSADRTQCPSCGATNVGPQTTCLRCGTSLSAPVPPAGPNWRATHRVPASGLLGFDAPGSATSAPIGGGMPVQLVQRQGDWAQVVAWTGWTGWVDGRLLVDLGG